MNRRMHQFTFVLLLILMFFSVGCDRNKVFEENKDLPKYIWNTDNQLSFNADIKDVSEEYDLFVNVRHSGLYKYSNIWLKVMMKDPESKLLMDERFEIVMAEKSGKWMGDCTGDICDRQATLRSKYKFNEPGIYTISLEHIMRQETLPAIMSVGFRIEKHDGVGENDNEAEE